MSPYAKKLLEDRYFISEISYEERKHKKVEILLEFHKLYKRWPNRKETFKNINIGELKCTIKRGITKVSDEDTQALIKAGFFEN